MKNNPSCEGNIQEINRNLRNQKPHYHIHNSLSPVPIFSLSSRTCRILRNTESFFGGELLAPCQAIKMEDHPCLSSTTTYSIYSQLPFLSRGHSSIRNLRMHHAVVTGTKLRRKLLVNEMLK
jgi:hypothetical protein